ncbi:hypothetical protein Tco_0379581 [Tanacetum coccineum]
MRVLTHRLTFNSRMRTPTIFTAKILLLKIMQILRGIEIKAVIWLWIDKLALRCTAVTILSIVPAKFTQDLLRVCGVVRETWRLIKRVRIPVFPLILGRPFLRTARVLIDVHGEELVIRDGLERIVFKPDGSQDNESIHMMDAYDDRVKDVCEPEVMDDSLTSVLNGNSGVEKDNVDHEVFKSNNENVLGIHDNEEEEIAFLDSLLEDENFFEMNDKKVESFESKTKEVFETKVEPKSKKELQVFHPDIENAWTIGDYSYVGSDYVFYEDFNLVDMIFPMNIQGKIFDPGITFHEKSFEKSDKSSKELAPSKALLTLDVFDPLHPPLLDFHVTKAFSEFTFSILKIFSKKFVEPGIKNVLVYLSSLVWGGCFPDFGSFMVQILWKDKAIPSNFHRWSSNLLFITGKKL